MERQKMYGRMRPNPPIERKGPVVVPCQKCKGKFTLEKEHREIFVVKSRFARKKDGTLTPATEIEDSYFRICASCLIKLKKWFESKI